MRLPNRILIAFLFALIPAVAQTNFGTIVGAVRDPSGAAIPGAKITITNTDTNVSVTTVSNADGQYEAPALIPGTYTVRGDATGFAPLEVPAVVVNVQSRRLVNLNLKVGAANQQVEVTAAPPLLETQSAQQGGVMNSRQINDLPINGRTYTSLVFLQAGASEIPSAYDQSHAAPDRFSVNGSMDLNNNFILNGTDNNSGSENLQEGSAEVIMPPPDALQEFRIQTRTYSAAFGGADGAVVNASIKSGGNQFHGDVWEFLRNSALDANTFFNNRNGVSKGQFSQNQFGATLGGPIVKNNTFFFMDYQGTISHNNETQYSTVPTPLMKTGDFSELPAGALPLTTMVPSQSGCILNNVIQANCIDPVGKNLMSLYPDPNVPSAVAAEGKPNSFTNNNYQYVYNVPNHTNSADIRIDHALNSKNQLFGVYDWNHINRQDPMWTADPLPGNSQNATQYYITNQAVALGLTTAFTADTVNQFHFGFNRMNALSDPINTPLGVSAAPQFGLNGVPVNAYTGGLPPISIDGMTGIGVQEWRPQWQISQVWQYRDSLTSIQGTHSLQFGFEYRRQGNNFLDIRAPQGEIGFSGIYTNGSYGLPDMLLGDASEGGQTTAWVAHDYYPGWAFYGQDTWRVTPNLTVSYGLRYDLYSPMLDRNNQLSNFSWANGGAIIPASASASGAYARSTIHPDRKNFGPRIGIDYQMTKNIVWRGGYAIFYNHRVREGSESMLNLNPPFVTDATISNQLGSTTPVFTLSNGFPSAQIIGTAPDITTLQIRAQDPNQRTAYSQDVSFGPEIQLGADTVLDIAGVGTYSRHQARIMNANQGKLVGYDAANNNAPIIAFPAALTNINTVMQSDYGTGQHAFLEWMYLGGSANYSGLQVSLKRHYSHGLAYGASYTWSHGMSDGNASVGRGWSPQSIYDLGAEMGNSPYDIRHMFVAHAIWDLPFGKGRHWAPTNRVVDLLAGGWQSNAIVTLQGGVPFNVSARDTSYSGRSHGFRPDCVGNILEGATTDPTALIDGDGFYMNPAAFAAPAPGLFGTCGPNILHSPGIEDVNFSLFKQFPVSEGRRLEFRAEFYNFLNHPNFGRPGSTFGQASFGKITSTTGDPREIQFALKFYF